MRYKVMLDFARTQIYEYENKYFNKQFKSDIEKSGSENFIVQLITQEGE